MSFTAEYEQTKTAGPVFFSICIPTYERVFEVQRCLDSIRVQTFKNFEVIISDNSTNSEVEALAISYKQNLSLRYHRNRAGSSSIRNFNTVIELAEGQYLILVMSDDYFASIDAFKVLYGHIIQHPKNKVFISNTIIKKQKKHVKRKITTQQIKTFSKEPNIIYLGNLIGTPSAVVFSSRLKNIKYNEHLSWFGDSEYYIRLTKKNKPIFLEEYPIIVDEDSPNRQTFTIINNPQLIIFEHFLFFVSLKISRNYLKFLIYFFRSTKKVNRSTVRQISELGKNKGLKFYFFYFCLKLKALCNTKDLKTQESSHG